MVRESDTVRAPGSAKSPPLKGNGRTFLDDGQGAWSENQPVVLADCRVLFTPQGSD